VWRRFIILHCWVVVSGYLARFQCLTSKTNDGVSILLQKSSEFLCVSHALTSLVCSRVRTEYAQHPPLIERLVALHSLRLAKKISHIVAPSPLLVALFLFPWKHVVLYVCLRFRYFNRIMDHLPRVPYAQANSRHFLQLLRSILTMRRPDNPRSVLFPHRRGLPLVVSTKSAP
jgi:hypothetical protein